MKINYIPMGKKNWTRFTVFAKPDYEALAVDKTIDVTIKHNTKTTVSTDVQWWDYCAYINTYIEWYKFHETNTMNYLFWENQHKMFFKLSKKQGKKEYMEYLEKVLTKFFWHRVDELTVNLYDNVFVW